MPKILILETDRQLAKNTSDFLVLQGHQVDIYSDPQSAISSADTNCPDVVVLDLMLAGRSGIEFLYELRSYPEWQQIPVIVTSKLTDEELQAYLPAFGQLNVSGYLHKPTTPLADLAAMVQKLLTPATV
jgi:DNA-binding response OmpR family regulator